jgi:hypothetical protein
MKHITILILVALLTIACNQEPKKSATAPAASSTTAAASQSQTPLLPKLPNTYLQQMWDNGQMIDYLFHDLPFSMNQNEPASIKTNLTYIDEAPVMQVPEGCKPMARQFYQVGGDIIFEADVYFSEQCTFYVFFVDGKPKYANQMAESGRQFFTSMIRQAMKASGNLNQG